MKKVRFSKLDIIYGAKEMDEGDCHFPRPFIQNQMNPTYPAYPQLLHFNSDPIQMQDCSNNMPYPAVHKTNVLSINESKRNCLPSNDLELSLLDCSLHQSKEIGFPETRPVKTFLQSKFANTNFNSSECKVNSAHVPTLNKVDINSDNSSKVDDFFLRRDSFHKLSIHSQIDKENCPRLNKLEFVHKSVPKTLPLKEVCGSQKNIDSEDRPNFVIHDSCQCHHCVRVNNVEPNYLCRINYSQRQISRPVLSHGHTQRDYNSITPSPSELCINCVLQKQDFEHNVDKPSLDNINPSPQNAIDKKSWSIQKYEQGNKKTAFTDVDKQNSLKEKREPTVSDLFKIIKLQNEQLQLLQDKVDKFISANTYPLQSEPPLPITNDITEKVSKGTVSTEQHKVSVGVMTSFEMVRTSTIINKEILTHTHDNAQVQCNRSQISIKEVVSKTQSVNSNVLNGLAPISNIMETNYQVCAKESINKNVALSDNSQAFLPPADKANEEKTLNELSLCNVQIENVITPAMSPEPSLYLDIRDYSDSDSGSDDQSNVGWTYYNKVMNHVNGMLHDSDMPSSASALYKNTRQHCLQMQMDKTNVSVTKRVKFGDDPLGLLQPHIYTASSDTSIKMNQLATKYLKAGQPPAFLQQTNPKLQPTNDLSLATKHYMEKHNLLQGPLLTPASPPIALPRFLDITALKQQPKLL